MALELPEPRAASTRSTALPTSRPRRLRTPLAPEISFGDDPLRMLRAARFVAGARARARRRLVAAIEEMRGRLEIVSAERIRDELSKLLVVDDPVAGPVVSRATPGSPTSSCPSSTRCSSSRTRSTSTRTCSRTRSRSCATRRPSCGSASPRSCTTSASPRPARIGADGVTLPPPRGRRRAHGRGAAARAALPERHRRGRHQARLPAPAHPHVRDGLDRQRGAPLRARRRRRCSTSSTS